MRKSQVKPWLNEDGSVKSDAKIRKAGQQWPPSVWEAYLSTFEVRMPRDRIFTQSQNFNQINYLHYLFIHYRRFTQTKIPR